MGWYDAELATKHAWSAGFFICSLQFCIIALAGYLWLTVAVYRRGERAVGVIFTALALLAGGGWVIGVVLGLILGWVRVGRWQVTRFMTAWTAVILAALGNLAVAVAMREMSLADWRENFGWLPRF